MATDTIFQTTKQDPTLLARGLGFDNLLRQIYEQMLGAGATYQELTDDQGNAIPGTVAYRDANTGLPVADPYVVDENTGAIIQYNQPIVTSAGGPSNRMGYQVAGIDPYTYAADQYFQNTGLGSYDPYDTTAQARLANATAALNTGQTNINTAVANARAAQVLGGDAARQAQDFGDTRLDTAQTAYETGIVGAPGIRNDLMTRLTAAYGDLGDTQTYLNALDPKLQATRGSLFATGPTAQTVSNPYSGLTLGLTNVGDAYSGLGLSTRDITDPYANLGLSTTALTDPYANLNLSTTAITDPYANLTLNQYTPTVDPFGYSAAANQPSVSDYYAGLQSTVSAPTAYTQDGKGLTEQAGGVLQSGLGYLRGAAPSTGNRFDPSTDVTAYMDPYQQDVIDTSIQALRDASTEQSIRDDAQAVAAGAFGGSRAAVMEASRQSELAKNEAALTAQLQSQGYDKALANAMAAYEADKASDLAVGQSMTDTARALGQLGQTEAGIGDLGFQQLLAQAGGRAQYDQSGIAAYSAIQNALAQRAQGSLGYMGVEQAANDAYNQAILAGASGEQATAIANQRAEEAYNQSLLAQAGGVQARDIANQRAQADYNQALLAQAGGSQQSSIANRDAYNMYMSQLDAQQRGQLSADQADMNAYDAYMRQEFGLQDQLAKAAQARAAMAGQFMTGQQAYADMYRNRGQDYTNLANAFYQQNMGLGDYYLKDAAAEQGIGGLYGQYMPQMATGMMNIGSSYSNLGGRMQAAQAADIDRMLNFGRLYQSQTQNQYDTNRRNAAMDFLAPIQYATALANRQLPGDIYQISTAPAAPDVDPFSQAIGTAANLAGGIGAMANMGSNRVGGSPNLV